MPTPIKLPARVLDAVEKSPTFSLLLENWDPKTSLSRLMITYQEAKDMIQALFPTQASSLVERGLKDFRLRGSGGWKVGLFYRSDWHPKVLATLSGPDYGKDFFELPPPMVFTGAEFAVYDFSQRGRG